MKRHLDIPQSYNPIKSRIQVRLGFNASGSGDVCIVCGIRHGVYIFLVHLKSAWMGICFYVGSNVYHGYGILVSLDFCFCSWLRIILLWDVFFFAVVCFIFRLLFVALSSYVSLISAFKAPLPVSLIHTHHVFLLSTTSLSGRYSNVFSGACKRAPMVNVSELTRVHQDT